MTRPVYIYQIVNIINNKRYIGSTLHRGPRFTKHIWLLKKNLHHCKYLQNAWNKYGENNFKFEIIKESTEEFRIQEEQSEIDKIDEYQLYNSHLRVDTINWLTGENAPGVKLTEKEMLNLRNDHMDNPKLSQKELSKKYGLKDVGPILRNKSWYDPLYIQPVNARRIKNKLSSADALKIRESFWIEGKSLEELEKIWNISPNKVRQIIYNGYFCNKDYYSNSKNDISWEERKFLEDFKNLKYGVYLQNLRKKYKKTCKDIKLNKSSLNRIEHDKTALTHNTLRKFIKSFHISIKEFIAQINELIGFTTPPPTEKLTGD